MGKECSPDNEQRSGGFVASPQGPPNTLDGLCFFALLVLHTVPCTSSPSPTDAVSQADPAPKRQNPLSPKPHTWTQKGRHTKHTICMWFHNGSTNTNATATHSRYAAYQKSHKHTPYSSLRLEPPRHFVQWPPKCLPEPTPHARPPLPPSPTCLLVQVLHLARLHTGLNVLGEVCLVLLGLLLRAHRGLTA